MDAQRCGSGGKERFFDTCTLKSLEIYIKPAHFLLHYEHDHVPGGVRGALVRDSATFGVDSQLTIHFLTKEAVYMIKHITIVYVLRYSPWLCLAVGVMRAWMVSSPAHAAQLSIQEIKRSTELEGFLSYVSSEI